jgi:uncharacterized membrane protein
MRYVGAHEVGTASMIIRPNRSLSVGGVAMLFVVLSTFVLTVGVGFALAGAWMVLPFAATEIIVVALLCRWLYRHVDDCELVVVEPERVRVMKRRGAEVSHHDFARYWVHMRVERAAGEPNVPRLRIGSHGRFVNLADDVNEADRLLVARELKRLLG